MIPPSTAPPPPPPVPPAFMRPGGETARMLRPYAITGGRTAAPQFLNLETQLCRTARAEPSSPHRWESAQIIDMADKPIALVEVAARIGIPVGVAKVVVADLIDQGAITTGAKRAPDESFSSLLERVLDGLDRI